MRPNESTSPVFSLDILCSTYIRAVLVLDI